MKTNDSVKAVIMAITTLCVLVTMFSSTVSKVNQKQYVSENEIALGQSVITQKPEIEDIEINTLDVNPVKLTVAEGISKEQRDKEILETKKQEIVYENITLGDLSQKLDRSLKGELAGKGITFASYATELGVDPYLAVAIALHETGCNWNCSNAVKTKNNVGGMMGSNGLLEFDTLDEGIKAYINNLYKNYVSQGLTTADTMASKYAASDTWASKVNTYINKIKAA